MLWNPGYPVATQRYLWTSLEIVLGSFQSAGDFFEIGFPSGISGGLTALIRKNIGMIFQPPTYLYVDSRRIINREFV